MFAVVVGFCTSILCKLKKLLKTRDRTCFSKINLFLQNLIPDNGFRNSCLRVSALKLTVVHSFEPFLWIQYLIRHGLQKGAAYFSIGLTSDI